MVERECEKIETEVREQVEREMRAKKDAKRRTKSVTPFDDVKGWDRRIKTIKREIRQEFEVDLDRKVVKKEPTKPARNMAGRVTQVMPSARKAFMESLKRKGVIAEKDASAEKAIERRTSIKVPVPRKSPPQALTVKEELLPIVHDRLLRENNRKNNKSNVALVHASHGCRTSAFRSRLTAHTLLGVDIKPTTTSVAMATVIAAAHKDTSVEEEEGSEGHEEASNVEVISVVSTPSLFVDEHDSSLAPAAEVVADGPKCCQREAKTPAAAALSTDAIHGDDNDDDEESDLIFHLVKMEVEAENQDAPPPRGENENSQEYSENFEDEMEAGDNDDAATMRSDRLSTIPEDADESRGSATEFSLDRRGSSQVVGMKGDGADGTAKSQSESLVLESAPDSRELAATAFAQDSTAAANLLESAPELDPASRARESSPTQQSIEERPATPPIPASSERSRSNAALESSLELSKCDEEGDQMDVAEDPEKKEESESGAKKENRATDPVTVDAVGQTSLDHDSSFERLKTDRALEANTSSFSTSSLDTASKVSLSEVSSGQLLLLADAAIASEEGEVGAACTATGYFADLSASSAAEDSAPPRLSRLRRKSFEADPARLSSTSSESRSEGEVVLHNLDSKSPA